MTDLIRHCASTLADRRTLCVVKSYPYADEHCLQISIRSLLMRMMTMMMTLTLLVALLLLCCHKCYRIITFNKNMTEQALKCIISKFDACPSR